MKDKIYFSIIGLLVVSLGLSMYLLYSKKNIEDSERTQKLQDNKIVDIKRLKQEQKRTTTFTPHKIDTQKISKKLANLKQTMKQTQSILKEYNQNNTDIIIKDSDIDKLISLDLKHSNKTQNTSNNQDEILKNEEKENKIKKESTGNTKPIFNTNPKVNSYSFISSSSPINSDNFETEAPTPVLVPVPTTQTHTQNQTQSQSEDVIREVINLQTQIDAVKKIISQVSAEIN